MHAETTHALNAAPPIAGSPVGYSPVCRRPMRRCRALVRAWLALLPLAFGHAGTAQAATNVGGPLTVSTTWTLANSPYTVTSDVSINSGSTLTIDPGVVILFNPGTHFMVLNGSVVAKGLPALPIVFTSARDVAGAAMPAAPGDWGQIRFTAGTTATAEFDTVQVRYGSGIDIVSSSPTLNRVAIVNSQGPAITMDLQSSPKGVGLTATGNTVNGIVVPSGDILGNVSWALVGIPYVLQSGTLGIGVPATITGITPNIVQAGQVLDATIAGTRLNTPESIVSDLAGITVAIQPGASATAVPVRITAADTASPGTANLSLQVAAGLVSVPITVTAPKPKIIVKPNPIAIPPDASSRAFGIDLSRADTVDYTVGVATDTPAIATVSAATATIPAGQTRVTLNISGLVVGETVLRITSPELGNVAVPVYVTPDYNGINSVYGDVVGVQVGPIPTSPPSVSYSSELLADAVGVTVGAVLNDIQPKVVIVGTSSVLTLQGNGLPQTLTVTASPATGLVLGAPTVAADGKSAQISITVGNNAPLGPVRLLLRASSAANATIILPARADADQLLVSLPLPQIDSITPNYGKPGDVINGFTVRGSNLAGAQALNFLGGDFTVSSTFTINAAGTQLQAGVTIPANAPVGDRTVVVTTPAGPSSSVAAVGNTFTVYSTSSQSTNYDPVMAAAVGVDVAVPAGSVTATYDSIAAAPVGVVYGAGIAKTIPRNGEIGSSITLKLKGQGLSGVTAVNFNPATGLTIGPLVVAADGSSVDVPLTIAANAPQLPRAIAVTAGVQRIVFADPLDSVFTVTPPMPAIDSVTPIVLVAGSSAVGFTLRGRNFQSASAVKFNPPNDISVGVPVISAAGDTATFSVSVAAIAALGDRVVTIVTPAGESDATPSVGNTVKVAMSPGQQYDPLVTALVGVQVGPPAGTSVTFNSEIVADLVGVDVQLPPAGPVMATYDRILSAPVGVGVGAVARSLDQIGLIAGSSATFVVQGQNLPANTVVSVMPATGITVGAPTVAADGSQLSVNIAAAANAAAGPYSVQLKTGSTDIFFQPLAARTFVVGAGVPSISAISPIVANLGNVVQMTINGSNLNNLLAVQALPGSGITFDSQPVVAANGNQIMLWLRVAPNAALGANVIQVVTALGQSSSVAAPANTFTVLP